MWQGFGVECPPRDHETGTTFQAMLYEYCLENLSSIRWPKKYYETAMQSTEYRRHVLDVIWWVESFPFAVLLNCHIHLPWDANIDTVINSPSITASQPLNPKDTAR